MKPSPASSATVVRRLVNGSLTDASPDVLAVEEPMEIRLGISGRRHRPISITMRTPGNDFELTAGFLFTEGIVQNTAQIKRIAHCGKEVADSESAVRGTAPLPIAQPAPPDTNTILVDLSAGTVVDIKRLERHFYTTSSCGVCGKSSIEGLKTGAKKLDRTGSPAINAELIGRLPRRLRQSQDVFDQTGGLHASALFSTNGEPDVVREDVGRHNALDKVIGAKFLADKIPLSDSVLLVSGRASFELVQKALMAGIPIMAAVGAPSSLAVDLAREFGITLVGFVKDDSFNIYAGEQRVTA